jgi:hypothetical protein
MIRIALAMMAATIALTTTPAEARRATNAPLRATLDVAAIPAYPIGRQATRQPRAASRLALDANGTPDRAAGRHQAISRAPQGQTRWSTATGGGILLTGDPGFVHKAAAVIDDLVAAGYQPRRVTCLSFARSHVAESLHFQGRACDVAQCGWGCTPAPKVVLRLIVARHGLRDGCEFQDAGHFDDGPRLDFRRVLRNCGSAYAAAVMPVQFANARVKIKVVGR